MTLPRLFEVEATRQVETLPLQIAELTAQAAKHDRAAAKIRAALEADEGRRQEQVSAEVAKGA